MYLYPMRDGTIPRVFSRRFSTSFAASVFADSLVFKQISGSFDDDRFQFILVDHFTRERHGFRKRMIGGCRNRQSFVTDGMPAWGGERFR